MNAGVHFREDQNTPSAFRIEFARVWWLVELTVDWNILDWCQPWFSAIQIKRKIGCKRAYETLSNKMLSRIRGVVANYLASQARDSGIDSHQHLKDSWHIWRHLRNDTVFSCNLRCLLIFLHGRSRTYRVASLRAGPVGRISYNLYFDCKHVRYVTCDFNKRIYFF